MFANISKNWINKIKMRIHTHLPRLLLTHLQFLYHQGSTLNVKAPKTLNEKLQYLKLYGYQDLDNRWCDKYEVRRLIEELIGSEVLVPLFASGDDPDQLLDIKLPEQYVFKPNHLSGKVIIQNGTSRGLTPGFLRDCCKEWFKICHYRNSGEPGYKGIKPKYLLEMYLSDSGTRSLTDFKVHCFGGVPKFIQVDIDRQTAHKRDFFTPDWVPLKFQWSIKRQGKHLYPNGSFLTSRPVSLNSMLDFSARISTRFPYARIDWYEVEGKLYFGEVTLFHGGGFEQFTPRSFDFQFGSWLKFL